MNNVLLEVSQRDSYEGTVNGDYGITLSKAVYVYDGDEVAVSKIFIDTESSSDGIINIKDQINCTADAILYATNTQEDKVLAYGQGGSNDNRDYVFCTQTPPNPIGNEDMVLVESIIFSTPDKDGGPENNWGDPSGSLKKYPILFTYLDILDGVHVAGFDIPYVDISKHGIDETTIYLTGSNRILMKKNSAVVKTPANYKKCNINAVINQDNLQEKDDAGVSLSWRGRDNTPNPVPIFDKTTTFPAAFSANFSIPPNKYLPDDLATLINDELTKNLAPKSVLPGEQVVSPFLKTASQAQTDSDSAEPIIFVVADDTVNQIDSTFTLKEYYWVGTDTIQLAFDSTDNKFYWNQLHQSIYDTDGAIVSRMVPDTNTAPQRYLNISKNGGICFTDLTSTVQTTNDRGEIIQTSSDFWGNDVLKFDFGAKTSLLSPSFPYTAFLEGAEERTGSTQTIIDGVNTTNVRLDLNSAIDKKHYESASITDFDPIEVSLNKVIKAKESAVDGQILTSGYFLVEVDCGMRNEIIGTEKITHNINAIASRYYSVGSYTSTELDPSLIYKHRGEPLLLSDIRVRILTPDKKLANVGNDNSIFIEIVRGELSMQVESDD